MSEGILHPTARVSGHPIHPFLVPFPIACFIGALATDIAYWRTADMMWADFSAWLVTIGVVLGCIAAIVAAIDFLSNRVIRAQAPAWPYVIGNLLALIIAILNMLIHSRDAWTSVVPWGVTLSAITVVIVLVSGWLNWPMIYGRGVGVVR
jgi:uncharacterized membrane protein